MTVKVATPLLESSDPATGEVVGRHPVDDEASVRVAVERARDAATWWGELGFAERKARLLAWKRIIVHRLDELGRLMHAETGKPVDDAHAGGGAGDRARSTGPPGTPPSELGPRRVRPGVLGINQAASVEYQPLGVVGVIGPWNYPILTPMGSIAYALAAGNAVVFKPSEHSPGVGTWMADTFGEVVPELPVFQVVTGFGETGAALCRSGVDKLAFTGSTATAKRVMASCAETLTPVLIEAGGKDAVIVAADADVDAAAEAVAFGAMGNAGQTCVGIERAYVVDGVYDEFVERLAERAGRIQVGADPHAQLGPITMPKQLAGDQGAHRGRAAPRRPGGGRRDRVGAAAVRPPGGAGRRARGQHGRHRGDLRPDHHRDQGARHRRGGRQGQRQPVRPRLGRLQRQQAHRDGDRPPTARRDDLGQQRPVLLAGPRRCRSAAPATPASAGSTAPTACASSPGRRRSPGSGSPPSRT